MLRVRETGELTGDVAGGLRVSANSRGHHHPNVSLKGMRSKVLMLVDDFNAFLYSRSFLNTKQSFIGCNRSQFSLFSLGKAWGAQPRRQIQPVSALGSMLLLNSRDLISPICLAFELERKSQVSRSPASHEVILVEED